MTKFPLKTIVSLLFLSISIKDCLSQFGVNRNYLQVGDTIPDYKFFGVKDFSTSIVKISDFRGKWLILDLWNIGCLSCIESFPKINTLQQTFSKDVQFLMVGLQDKTNKIQEIYNKHKEYHKLSVANVFDSTYFNELDVHAGPYILVIAPDGIIKAITVSVTKNDIDAFIAGHIPKLTPAFTREESNNRMKQFDNTKPLLINNNGGADSAFLFRSILVPWNSTQPILTGHFSLNKYPYGFQAMGLSLFDLYNLAYFGKRTWRRPEVRIYEEKLYGEYWPNPILHIKDSGYFKKDTKIGLGSYSYSIIVPEKAASMERIMSMMKNDLFNYFKYNVEFIESEFPYWEISVDTTAYSRSTKDSPSISVAANLRLVVKNITVEKLQDYLAATLGYYNGIFLVNKKQQNIRLTFQIEGDLSNFKEVRELLYNKGVYLTQKKKRMKVMKISE